MPTLLSIIKVWGVGGLLLFATVGADVNEGVGDSVELVAAVVGTAVGPEVKELGEEVVVGDEVGDCEDVVGDEVGACESSQTGCCPWIGTSVQFTRVCPELHSGQSLHK